MSTLARLRRLRRLAAVVPFFVLASGLAAQSFAYVHGGVGNRCESLADDDAWFSFSGGVIRYTDDGGATMHNATVPADVRVALRGFHMGRDVAGPWGYCVGDDGVVLFSTDEGRTWTKQTTVRTPLAHPYHPDVPAPLWDVWFTTRLHGYIVGFENTIQETTDGGATWTNLAPTSGHLAAANVEWYQLHGFANGDFVLVGDRAWTLHRTASNGALSTFQIGEHLWCYQPQVAQPPVSPDTWNLELWGVDFIGDTGVAVGGVGTNDGYVFRSTDAGLTWTLDSACFAYLGGVVGVTPASFYGIELFDDADRGAACGYGSMVLVGGTSSVSVAPGACATCTSTSKSWVQTVCDSDQDPASDPEDDGGKPLLNGICASTSLDRGYAVGDFGVVRRTDDQGSSWTELQGLHRGRLQCGTFLDAQVGLVAGQHWVVYGTLDGGEHFSRDYAASIPIDPNTSKPYSGNFNDVAMATANNRAVVVGDRGRLVVRDVNNAWTEQPIGAWATGPQLNAVLMDASGALILVGGESVNGSTLHLSVAGSSFNPLTLVYQSQPVSTTIVDLAFDGTFVYHLTVDDRVYVTYPASSLTAVVAMVPIVGSNGTPTCLGVRSATDFYAANSAGEVFEVDVGTTTMQRVTAVSVDALGRQGWAIVPVPGTAEWWFTGANGHVVHFDGATTWTQPKSAIADNVVDAAFFGSTDGVLIGRKMNVTTW
jgi:photosystem II stability/assembly factor-like uncharacterized protein